MKRYLLACLLILVAAAYFLAAPFIGLWRLQSAVAARNTAALDERIDFLRVRRSLAAQVIATYLDISGKRAELGALGSALATNVGATLADPMLNDLINPERMLDLLAGRGVASLHLAPGSAVLPKDALGSLWQAFLNCEYGIGNFYISVPVNADAAEQYRLRLQVLQWTWTVTEIGLPQRVRIELAKELQRRIG